MRNKKGFTLIELLAVIVILGIIMVIAVPAITKYIDNSRKEGFTKTASGVVDAARLYYSNEYGNSSESTLEFECTTKECKTASGEKLELTKSPDKGSVKIFDDGEIIACFQRNMWYAVKNINDNEVKFGEGKCEYNTETNSYDTIELVSREMVDELQAELNALKAKGNASKEDILEAKTAVVRGKEITGIMKNNGNLNQTIKVGESITLAPGYYSGGVITAIETIDPNSFKFNGFTATVNANITEWYTGYDNGQWVGRGTLPISVKYDKTKNTMSLVGNNSVKDSNGKGQADVSINVTLDMTKVISENSNKYFQVIAEGNITEWYTGYDNGQWVGRGTFPITITYDETKNTMTFVGSNSVKDSNGKGQADASINETLDMTKYQ